MSDKFKVTIVFGTEDSRSASSGDWESLICAPDVFEFDTEPEKNAFLAGVEATAGWLEACVLDPRDVAAYHAWEREENRKLEQSRKSQSAPKHRR